MVKWECQTETIKNHCRRRWTGPHRHIYTHTHTRSHKYVLTAWTLLNARLYLRVCILFAASTFNNQHIILTTTTSMTGRARSLFNKYKYRNIHTIINEHGIYVAAFVSIFIMCCHVCVRPCMLCTQRTQWKRMQSDREYERMGEWDGFEPATFPRLLKPKTLSNRLVQTFHSRCMYDRFGSFSSQSSRLLCCRVLRRARLQTPSSPSTTIVGRAYSIQFLFVVYFFFFFCRSPEIIEADTLIGNI